MSRLNVIGYSYDEEDNSLEFELSDGKELHFDDGSLFIQDFQCMSTAIENGDITGEISCGGVVLKIISQEEVEIGEIEGIDLKDLIAFCNNVYEDEDLA